MAEREGEVGGAVAVRTDDVQQRRRLGSQGADLEAVLLEQQALIGLYRRIQHDYRVAEGAYPLTVLESQQAFEQRVVKCAEGDCAAEAVADDHQIVPVLAIDPFQLGEQLGDATPADFLGDGLPVPVGQVLAIQAMHRLAPPANIEADQPAFAQHPGGGEIGECLVEAGDVAVVPSRVVLPTVNEHHHGDVLPGGVAL